MKTKGIVKVRFICYNFAVCTAAAVLISRAGEKAENRRMDEAPERWRKNDV